MILFPVLFLILSIKHFLVDFMWQPEFEWRNKGTLFHWGGIRHSLKHAYVTCVILLFWDTLVTWSYPEARIELLTIFWVSCFEFVSHYIIDYAKMNISQYKGWKCNTHPEFWYLTGLDQLLHTICYIVIGTICLG